MRGRDKMKIFNFTTLSPECRNIELVKDVGQIPYVLGKEHQDIDTAIVASCIKQDGPNLENVQGLKIIHRPLFLKKHELTGVVYLLFHARKIDWLSLHHAGRRSYYWTKIYKFLNPKGKVYLKLDMDFRSCDMYDNDERERSIFSKNTNIIDLITVETEAIKNRIQKYSVKDIKILGNGYCKSSVEPNIFKKRKRSFITVGRLGTRQKATEILLDAFAESAKEHEWNLILVGSIEEEFKSYISDFFKKNPELKERVIFKGEINDRKSLNEEYCTARVFLLPSRWESWGLVVGEALSCGLRVIVSDLVPPMKEMTNNEMFGQIVPADDSDALCRAIIKETQREFSFNEVLAIKEYAENQFSWSKICDELYNLLMES